MTRECCWGWRARRPLSQATIGIPETPRPPAPGRTCRLPAAEFFGIATAPSSGRNPGKSRSFSRTGHGACLGTGSVLTARTELDRHRSPRSPRGPVIPQQRQQACAMRLPADPWPRLPADATQLGQACRVVSSCRCGQGRALSAAGSPVVSGRAWPVSGRTLHSAGERGRGRGLRSRLRTRGKAAWARQCWWPVPWGPRRRGQVPGAPGGEDGSADGTAQPRDVRDFG